MLERIPTKASFPLSLAEKPSAEKLKFQNKHAIKIKHSNFFTFISNIWQNISVFVCYP
jgi:hypothetical protein